MVRGSAKARQPTIKQACTCSGSIRDCIHFLQSSTLVPPGVPGLCSQHGTSARAHFWRHGRPPLQCRFLPRPLLGEHCLAPHPSGQGHDRPVTCAASPGLRRPDQKGAPDYTSRPSTTPTCAATTMGPEPYQAPNGHHRFTCRPEAATATTARVLPAGRLTAASHLRSAATTRRARYR